VIVVRQGILRHSRWDGVLIGRSLVHAGVLVVAPSIPVIALGLWWNSNTISQILFTSHSSGRLRQTGVDELF
jgi:hypothetical protein